MAEVMSTADVDFATNEDVFCKAKKVVAEVVGIGCWTVESVADDMVSLGRVFVVDLVCNVDSSVGVIVDSDGFVNVDVASCVEVLKVVGSVFDEVISWVVLLAWVVGLVAKLVVVSVEVFGFANNVVALVVAEA